jgi:hypothetical protein
MVSGAMTKPVELIPGDVLHFVHANYACMVLSCVGHELTMMTLWDAQTHMYTGRVYTAEYENYVLCWYAITLYRDCKCVRKSTY